MSTEETVCISGLYLRRQGGKIIVTVEIDGRWVDVITESVDGEISHNVYPSGIHKALQGSRPDAE